MSFSICRSTLLWIASLSDSLSPPHSKGDKKVPSIITLSCSQLCCQAVDKLVFSAGFLYQNIREI